MDKAPRNERLAVLLKTLSDAPGKIFTLGTFAEMFGSGKSSISEDIDIIQNILKKYGLGLLETIPGASGGVKYIPSMSDEKAKEFLLSLSESLSEKDRILPGGYLYLLDIIYDPEKVSNIACIFSQHFQDKNIDYVVTVETKGIPLAFATAKYLNVPLIIVRYYNEAASGSSVSINYVSGSSRRIQTMVLSLKALKRNSKLLFIDDFMKGGGTAKGIIELAKEFDCEVCGIGTLIETAEPERKLVDNCYSLLTLESVDEENHVINIKPGNILK